MPSANPATRARTTSDDTPGGTQRFCGVSCVSAVAELSGGPVTVTFQRRHISGQVGYLKLSREEEGEVLFLLKVSK